LEGSQNVSNETRGDRQEEQLQERMGQIDRKIVVLSGKGGVGKSTVAVNLAVALSLSGARVGLLDVDIHGPSVPQMLRLGGARIHGTEDGMLPAQVDSLKVMSLGFLLETSDTPVVWRGPMKAGVIRQFLADVTWGELDYLVVDCPPGTGDEPLSVVQLIRDPDGAVIVTTPQEVALLAVRKSVTFCRQLNLPVLGVVENMSGFACPKCGEVVQVFKAGGGRRMAAEMGVPFLGEVPITQAVVESTDSGRPCVQYHSSDPAARAFQRVAEAVRGMLEAGRTAATDRA
jgi:ATP-binding protein involved in chromosome partitioning